MDDLEIRPGLTIPGDELWFRASRSSGPGGQHVNRTASRVTLYWDLEQSVALTEPQREAVRRALQGRLRRDGVVWLSCDAGRSQHANRREACERLAGWVREALVPRRPRKKRKVSKAAKRRRLEAKRRRSDLKRTRGKVGSE